VRDVRPEDKDGELDSRSNNQKPELHDGRLSLARFCWKDEIATRQIAIDRCAFSCIPVAISN
jgi:CxxC motif-containing protein (DUF1111 family)